MDAPSSRLRVGLILAGAVFATGALAALMADAMQPAPSPTATPAIRPLPPAAPTASPGRRLVLAPIDAVAVNHIDTPAGTLYVVDVAAGLPSGCAQKGTHTVARRAEVITVTVLNSMPAGEPMCTMVYGSYELRVELGTGFDRGKTFTVRVNDKATSFTP